ncbi:hypothetical protein BFJ69_g4401 [Fusarium oxysporum]|uniref:Uncharacterized protein n=1 Tax=Fusarium oxysporum TaxID=5507 RepID=A0A420NJ33_FUSOX|nr:hypothetical protein BFJ69_g4401 [Fusarium oxysporum]
MGAPADHLPLPISEDAINQLLQVLRLPRASAIENPRMTAQYHSIYFITHPPIELSRGHYELVLRVAGNHLPNIKTKNEIGVMTWLSKNTTIPSPEAIAYHDSADNPAHPWGGIGGLTLDDRGEVQLGTVVDETFWQVPDIKALWPEGETVASLNIGGSYKT